MVAAAVAVAVPAQSVSATLCAVMPSPSAGGWTSAIPASGTISPQISGNFTGWTTVEGEQTWVSQRDAGTTTSNLNVNAVGYSGASIDVLAGVTYTFTFRVAATWAANHGNLGLRNGGQYLRVLVNNTDILGLHTRSSTTPAGYTQIPSVDGSFTWTTFSASYTATADGTVPFVFYNGLQGRDATGRTTDDILVTLPVITCSGP